MNVEAVVVNGNELDVCDQCGMLCGCICHIKAKHSDARLVMLLSPHGQISIKACRFLIAARLSVELPCDHGYQACPICDQCDCGVGETVGVR